MLPKLSESDENENSVYFSLWEWNSSCTLGDLLHFLTTTVKCIFGLCVLSVRSSIAILLFPTLYTAVNMLIFPRGDILPRSCCRPFSNLRTPGICGQVHAQLTHVRQTWANTLEPKYVTNNMSTESREAGKPSDNTLQGEALHCRSEVWVWWHLGGMWPNYGPQQPSPVWPVVSLVTLPSRYSALQASHVHPSCLSLARCLWSSLQTQGTPKPPLAAHLLPTGWDPAVPWRVTSCLSRDMACSGPSTPANAGLWVAAGLLQWGLACTLGRGPCQAYPPVGPLPELTVS